MNGTQMVSKQTLVPVLQAGTACIHCAAVLPCSGYTHWPAAAHTSARGVGSDGCDGEKHKKCFSSLQAEKEVSHLDMYSSQAGKGTGRREAVGWEAQHCPEDVRQMADLAVGWSQSDLQAFSAARAHNTTLHRGCQPSLAGLLGGHILSSMLHPKGSITDASCAIQPWRKAV